MKKRPVKKAAKKVKRKRAAKPSSFRGLIREMKQRHTKRRKLMAGKHDDDEDDKKRRQQHAQQQQPKRKRTTDDGTEVDDPALDVDLSQPPVSPIRNPESPPGGDVIGTPHAEAEAMEREAAEASKQEEATAQEKATAEAEKHQSEAHRKAEADAAARRKG